MTKAPLIVIDPGHGKPDPGTVDPLRGTTESEANLATAVTLAYLLKQAGYRIYLTRTDDTNPGYPARVKDRGQALFISVHYDTWQLKEPTRGVYYRSEAGKPKVAESNRVAKELAAAWDKALGGKKGWVKPTKVARFKRLYIDDNGAYPAVLIEVDRITDYQPTKEYRLRMMSPLVDAIKDLIPLKDKEK